MKHCLYLIMIVMPVICFSQVVKKQITYTQFGTCYDDRETTSTIDSGTGKIIKINENVWAIQPDNSGTRYAICDIPDKLKVENQKIKFSGDVKKVKPTEKMVASPFKIKSITTLE